MEDRNRNGDLYSVDVFCKRHGISRALLYRLWASGKGPRYLKIASRTFISVEAAAEWRKRLEAETAGTAA